jgi:hypothetical protein
MIRLSKHAKNPAPISKALSEEDREAVDRIVAAIDTHAPKIGRAFAALVESARARVDMAALEAAITNAQVWQVQPIIDAALTQSGILGYTLNVRGAVEAGANLSRTLGRLDVVWDVANPRTAEFLRNYSMGQIREITQQTRAAVHEALSAGINAGRNGITIARDIRQTIGLTARQEAAVQNYRRLLEEGQRSEALTRRLRDRRFDPSLRGGKPLSGDKIDTMVARYRERFVKYRRETIGRTEAIRAVNAGQIDLYRQAIARGEMAEHEARKTWVYTHDDRVRAWHASIPSLNPEGRGINEPFVTEKGPLQHPGDPNGSAENVINCRCTVVMRYRPTLV